MRTTLFVAFLALAACGGDELVPVASPPEDRPPAAAPPPSDERESPEKPPTRKPEYQKEILNDSPLVLTTYSVATISVRLSLDGRPVPDERISFELSGETGGAHLASGRAFTGPDGVVELEVVSGGEPAAFGVRVSSDYTDMIVAPVEVVASEDAPATLIVRVTYHEQARQPIDEVDVSIFDGNSHSCRDVLDGKLSTAIERRSMGLTDSLSFEELSDQQQVTVLARGRNAVATVAAGCVEGISLEGGQNSSAEVLLIAAEMDPTGIYELRTDLDTTGAVPGKAGELLDLVAKIFEHPDDPARFLINLLEEQSGYSLGFMRETAISYVDQLLRSIVPPDFMRLLDLLGDLSQVVTKMSFEGTLTIEESWDGRLLASEQWETVIFRWREGCEPEPFPGCDEHRVALRNTHIGEINTSYEVRVEGETLRMGYHERELRYASFFHLFILEIVYPYIVAGASSTADLLRGAIDCEAVAGILDEADGTVDGYLDIGVARLSVDSLEGYCDAGLGATGAVVDGLLDDLASRPSSILALEGTALMIDDSRDLRPEALTDGIWTGTMGLDEKEESARGSFEAHRSE